MTQRAFSVLLPPSVLSPGKDLFRHQLFFVSRVAALSTCFVRSLLEHLYLYPRYIPLFCHSENLVLEESAEFNFLCEFKMKYT